MKNQYSIIALACVTALLFSSCSRVENITVSKRHYRSGFYVDLGSRSQTAKPEVASAPEATVAPVQTAAVEAPPVSAPANSTVAEAKPASVQQIVTANNVKKKPAKKNSFYASRQTSADVATIQQESISEHANALTDVKAVERNESSDMPQWALILFAIILPPLAVGLKFGIVTQFWISIILTLLFWIPGVIYALILILQ